MKHDFSISINGITLLPITLQTSEKYRLLRNRPEIGKWFTYKSTISAEQQVQWFYDYLKKSNEVMFSIYDEKGNYLGSNSIYDITESKAEYGRLIIDPKYSGFAYGYKATIAAAIIAKKQMHIKKLQLEVYTDNEAALRTYQKAGYKEVGEMLDNYGNIMKVMELDLDSLNYEEE